VQVHYGEGVANHTGPEPCDVTREGDGEASAGECIGQPLSREKPLSWVPTRLGPRKATRAGAPSASPYPTRRGLRHWHVRTLLAREPGDLPIDHRPEGPSGPWREGEEP